MWRRLLKRVTAAEAVSGETSTPLSPRIVCKRPAREPTTARHSKCSLERPLRPHAASWIWLPVRQSFDELSKEALTGAGEARGEEEPMSWRERPVRNGSRN
jgi:hypothetical protein